MKKKLIIVGACVVICLGIISAYVLQSKVYKVSTPYVRMSLGGETLKLEIADTEGLRVQGLSGRKALGVNEGMLFDFSEDGYHQFWMKDMKFPIDIIWFDAGNRIVDVKERATPESYPEVFTPHTLARYVLEVPAGFFENHHLKMGNILEIIK